MLRISGRKKLLLNGVTKILVSLLFGFSMLASLMFLRYKPVYKVSINNVDSGYVTSKNAMEKSINEFILNGDAENVAYVVMNAVVDYEMMLVEKNIMPEEEKILAAVKDKCDVYYRVYAIKVGDEEKCVVDNLEDAETMRNDINEQQAKFTNKAEIEIVEKNVLEYDNVEDIEVAVADIIKPLKEENDSIVKIRTQLASSKTISKELLQTLKENLTELDFRKPVDGGVITSRYGWRSTGYHYGLDIGMPLGEPIYACESGIVTYSAWMRKLWIFS